MKHTFKARVLCAILTLSLLMQIVSVSTLAVEFEDISTNIINSSENNNNVLCEITDKRTEYSKEFLLTDGTFYKITTTFPIHFLDNGEWVDNYDIFETTETVDGIKEAIREINVISDNTANYSIQLANETSEPLSNMDVQPIYNADICWTTDYEAYEITATDGAVRISNSSIEPYTAKNKAINSVSLNFTRDSRDNPADVVTTFYEGTSTVTAENIDELKKIDELTVSANEEYSIDITNIFSKWDLGLTENYGIVLRATGGTRVLTIRNIYFEVFYEEIDLNDIDYTYRTFDMGRVGVFSINNYTNTVLYEQRLFKLDSKVLPIYVTRINDGANPTFSNSAGFGFTWNVESTISISGELAVWKTIDQKTKLFAPEENLTVENGYQVWKEVGSNGIEDQTSIYFYVLNNEIENNSLNYSNVFIKQGDTKYMFDNNGRLVVVERIGANGTPVKVDIVYDSNGNLDYIKDENEKTYDFTYSYSYSLNYDYLSNITIDDEAQTSISFTTSKINVTDESDPSLNQDRVQNKINYSNGNEVVCDTDKYGNVLWVLDTYENSWDFQYINEGERTRELGNRITKLIKFNSEGENAYYNNLMYTFDIPGCSYREITRLVDFAENLEGEETTETIQFDKEHRIITHKDFDNHCICVEYDDNGVVSSFAFDENETNLLSNCSFEEDCDFNSDWKNVIGSVEIVESSWSTNEHGNFEIKLSNSNNESSTVSVSQNIEGTFSADKTYVVGAWIKVDGTLPVEDKKVGFEVLDISNTTSETEETAGVPITFGTIDNGLDEEWQYRLQAFKLTNPCTKIKIRLTALNQCGEIRFDEITCFAATESNADLNNLIISSPVSYAYNDAGLITNETMTNGVQSLSKSYVYNNDGSVSETSDFNGIKEYYSYNSNETIIGTTKNAEGVVTDGTSFKYDALGQLEEITNIVNGVSDGKSTNFTYVGDKIRSVKHNGYVYTFTYSGNNIIAIEACSSENFDDDSGDYLNENDVQSIVNYEYFNNNVGYIVYGNNYEVEYSYNTNGTIKYIRRYYVDPYTFEETDVCKYNYSYNGEEITVYDSGTGYTTIYSSDNYTVKLDDEVIYTKETITDGGTVETIAQKEYVGENNTDSDIITSSVTSTTSNSTNGDITNSSVVVVNKNHSNGYCSEMTFERSSITDYFNRVIGKQTTLNYEVGDGTTYKSSINTHYDFKQLSVGVTSGLISTYTTTVSGDEGISGQEFSEFMSYTRNYEYDNKGNLKYVYMLNNSIETPCEFYEYDNSNQLITFVDFSNQNVVSYTYDAGGRLTLKTHYNYSELLFDCASRTITSKGTANCIETYSYPEKDSNLSNQEKYNFDKLISYSKTEYEETGNITDSYNIVYDEIGNPMSYVGTDIDNNTIIGDLKWNGLLLDEFDSDTFRIEYNYDENGYRNMKTVYNKSTTNGVITETFSYKMSYIWDDGVLTNLIYQGGDAEEISINIIYDQENSPIGYITSFGIPYYFIKDVNENVIGLIHPDGSMLYSISYDAFGAPKFNYHGENFAARAWAKVFAIFNPINYHGYIYDYETGMYCSQGRCYSPTWGRYINADNPTKLLDSTDNVLSSNTYLFCNNNPVNNIDSYAIWSRDYFELGWNARGFTVEMSELFASRSFCAIFANQFLKEYGEWSAENGYTYLEMDTLRIASDLFAHYVAKNAPSAINKVNAYWGDGWIQKNEQLDIITINKRDTNAWKYEKIWYAAPEIKAYAWGEGVYITI